MRPAGVVVRSKGGGHINMGWLSAHLFRLISHGKSTSSIYLFRKPDTFDAAFVAWIEEVIGLKIAFCNSSSFKTI